MRLFKNTLILGALFLASCAGFEKIALFQGRSTVSLGEPALMFNKGDITQLKWEGNSPDVVEVSEDGIVLNKDNTKKGNRNSYVYLDVDNVDFRGDLAIVINAKIEGGKPAKLRLELIDKDGHIANGKDLTNLIRVTDNFVEYTYKTEGSFTQLVPELADVNPSNIKQIRFVFAPTSKAHEGTLKIKDVKIKVGTETAPKKNLGPTGKDGGLIADFTKGVKGWVAKGSGMSVSKGKKSLRVDAVNVGPNYQSISSKIDLIDLSNHKVIKVRVKVYGDVKPFLRLDVQDINGSVSNFAPVWLELNEVSNINKVSTETSPETSIRKEDGSIELSPIELTAGPQYVDYYFDFTKRFKQSYPKTLTLDEKRINKIILYLNPGYNRYSGQVYIESIESVN